MLYVDTKQVKLPCGQVLIKDLLQCDGYDFHFFESIAHGLQLVGQFRIYRRIFVIPAILVKSHFPALVRNDGVQTDIPFPDSPEFLYQRRISVGTDAAPAFHVKFRGIRLLNGIIAADVHIEPGPFLFAENTLQE